MIYYIFQDRYMIPLNKKSHGSVFIVHHFQGYIDSQIDDKIIYLKSFRKLH